MVGATETGLTPQNRTLNTENTTQDTENVHWLGG